MSEEIVNLDALVTKTIVFEKNIQGEIRSWRLRDGMPPDAMLPALALRLHNGQRARTWAAVPLPQAGDDDATAEAKAEAAMATMAELREAQKAETLQVFAAIWHYSCPDDATEDLAAWFNPQEQEHIIDLFFTRPSSASSALSNATTPATPPTGETPAPDSTPNREQRRTRSPRGAIPSQKRLSRELRGM